MGRSTNLDWTVREGLTVEAMFALTLMTRRTSLMKIFCRFRKVPEQKLPGWHKPLIWASYCNKMQNMS